MRGSIMSDTARSETNSNPREEVLTAVSEIRREAAKAAAIHAILDAMAVFLVLRLVTQLVSIPVGTEPLTAVPIPDAVGGPLRAAGIAVPDVVGISGVSLVVVAIAVSWAIVDVAFRYDRLGVEQFEAHNPAVEEALRTARDTAEGDVETQVATTLYRTVLRRLGETSSRSFLQQRQLIGVTAVLVLCSAGIVGVTGAGISPLTDSGTMEMTAGSIDSGSGAGVVGAGGGGAGGVSNSDGGGDLLGDEGAVERGTENQSLRLRGENVDNGGGGEYGGGSVAVDSAAVDASQAAFTDEKRPEAADLVRAYNKRIREEEPDV